MQSVELGSCKFISNSKIPNNINILLRNYGIKKALAKEHSFERQKEILTSFLEIPVNNGIVGFISYYVFYVYIFLSYIRIKKYNKIDANWLLTVLLMLIIADMTVLTYIEKPSWLIFSIVLFVIHSYKKDDCITLELWCVQLK